MLQPNPNKRETACNLLGLSFFSEKTGDDSSIKYNDSEFQIA